MLLIISVIFLSFICIVFNSSLDDKETRQYHH